MFMCLNYNNIQGEDLASKIYLSLSKAVILLLLVICMMLFGFPIKSRHRGYKTVMCSTELSIKFQLLIKTEKDFSCF